MGSFRRLGLVSCVAAAGLWVAGCDIQTNLAPDSEGQVQVTLQRADASPLALAVAEGVEAGIAGAAMATVPRDNLEALTVNVISVELLEFCEEAEGQEGQNGENSEDLCEWVPVPVVDAPVILDLLNLPSESESPIVLAAGDVPAGEYHKLRVLVEGGTAWFKEDFWVGRWMYQAKDDQDEFIDHDVTIPSTRIKVDIALTVDEGNADDVALLFDEDATFKKVIATGSGMVKVPPVLKSWSHM